MDNNGLNKLELGIITRIAYEIRQRAQEAECTAILIANGLSQVDGGEVKEYHNNAKHPSHICDMLVMVSETLAKAQEQNRVTLVRIEKLFSTMQEVK